VRTYASVGDFLLVNSENAPACLLLEVSMPGPSSLDLQESLSKTGRLLPVIFLTGRGDIPMSVRAMKAGAVDFLTKPVKKGILLEAVKIAIALDTERRAHREQLEVWRARYQSLTSRERDVFTQVIAGQAQQTDRGRNWRFRTHGKGSPCSSDGENASKLGC
jgi:FixJ family two-component response regulator